MVEKATLQNTGFQESITEILPKILSKEYWLLRRQERSTVWQVYRQIVRSDGTKLRDYYFCTGCKRLMRSRDTSSLRSHICHVKYLQRRATDGVPDLNPKIRKNRGHSIHWPYRATKTLLSLWEKNLEHLQSGPGSSAANALIYRKIANKMAHMALKPSDIKIRMDNLSDRYRREVERQKVTGRPSKWLHFHDLQVVLNPFEENDPSGTSLDEENSFPDMEADVLIQQNDNDEIQDAIDIEAMPSLETYEEELDQQHSQPKRMYRAKRWRAKRFMAIQEEKLALEKENFKSFQSVMREMMSCNRNLCKVLYDID